MKGKKHIFFDLDDTLWDFEKNSAEVLIVLFDEFELKQKLKTDFNTFIKEYKKVNLWFWSLYNKREINKEYLRNNRFNETFKKFNYENYEENLVLTDIYLNLAPHGKNLKAGCKEVLEYLDKKYKLHIITNGFKEIQGIKLDGCDLRKYFKNIVISEEHNLSKPDEKIFRLAESLANTHSGECVMIGDNFESDVEGALAAGWDAIHYSADDSTFFSGVRINRLEELKGIF